MELINYSAEPDYILYSWLPHGLKAEKVIFFPDACPGKSPLPTGTVVFTRQEDWRKYAVSDCGCGMLLARSGMDASDFSPKVWDRLYADIKAQKGGLGDLGSGNHFLDALRSEKDGSLYFLIHTGSRKESDLVDDLIDQPEAFDTTFAQVCDWARHNRFTLLENLRRRFGKMEVITDRNHNHFEHWEDGVIIRKGAAQVPAGGLHVIPSNMEGPVVLVQANQAVEGVFNSLCHGTGRVMSRSRAKLFATDYNYDSLRERVYIPSMISNNSIKTDAPFCYRELDDCLLLVEDLLTEVERFQPIAYLGQL